MPFSLSHPLVSRIFRICAVALLLAFLPQRATPAEDTDEEQPLVIRKIHIERDNVFTPEDNPLGLGDPYINRLHIITRKRIIRQELLFKEGEQLDRDLLRETERNLRKLNYIASVRITESANPDGSVDIYVRTRDLWTTILGVSLTKEDDELEYAILVEEQSILGLGKPVHARFDNRKDGRSFEVNHTAMRLLGTRWSLGGRTRIGPSDRYRYDFVLDHPFYALDVKWFGRARSLSKKTLLNEDTSYEILEKLQSQSLSVSRSFGGRFKKAIATAGYLHEEASSTDYIDTINEYSGFLTFRGFRFARTHRIDKMRRTEDLELGTILGGGVAHAGGRFGQGRDYFRILYLQALSFPVGSKSWIFERFSWSRKYERDEWADRKTAFEIKVFSRKLPRQTVALRLFAGSRHKRDTRTEQFILHQTNGLRGYTSADSIIGDKALLFNLEDRIFTDVELLTLAFGGVVFFDGGNAWREGEPIKMADLNYSFGFGFRWELTKSATAKVTRLDFSFPLDGRAVSLGNMTITLSAGQIFTAR